MHHLGTKVMSLVYILLGSSLPLLKAEILFLTSLRHEIFLGEKWTNCIPWHLLFPQKRIPLKEKFAWPTPNGDEANDPNICILHLKYTIVAYFEAEINALN